MRIAHRLDHIPISFWEGRAQAIRQLQMQGHDIIRLDVGNPDMPPHDAVLQALTDAIHDPAIHGYPGSSGLPALRQAVCRYYVERFGVALDPDTQVLPLLGSKEGIAHMAQAILDPGDVALIPTPSYPTYRDGTILAGGVVHYVPLVAENGFLPDLGAIPGEVIAHAKVLWLNYPNNPTGAVAPLDFLAEAVDWVREHDLLLCHDAPYADVAYEGYRPPSILEVLGSEDVVLEFNSLSKTYNMAGWRIAMAVGSAQAITALKQVKSNTDSGIFAALQMAAVEAFQIDRGWIAARNEVYGKRRDRLVAALSELGLDVQSPQATLYIWGRVPDGWTGRSFSDHLLAQTQVSIVPGDIYGPGNEAYVRVSVTAPLERIEAAVDRWRAILG